MSALTRRKALTALGTGLAVAALPALAEAKTATVAFLPSVEPEHPWDRTYRLMRELVEALADGSGRPCPGPAGKYFVKLYPKGCDDDFSGLVNIAMHKELTNTVSIQMQKVLDAHRAAREALCDACDATDETLMEAKGKKVTKAAERRWNKLSRLEEDALTAVCATRPHGCADMRARARYLNRFASELNNEQIFALINAGARS